MTGPVVALLLAAAGAVLLLRPVRTGTLPPPPTGTRPVGGVRDEARASDHDRIRRAARRAVDPHELPLFVHQLAGLLRAGRPPHALWADMERVYQDAGTAFAISALPVIAGARRAAALGLSVPEALRGVTPSGRTGAADASEEQLERLWVDLAGCLLIADRSGAPLAGILDHYAGQLDSQLDARGARETALAGPRATVVLLAWLPAVGLVLAFALGVNPVEVLLGSPPGRLTLAAGAVLMVLSRTWTRRLVRVAGGTP